MQMIKYKSQLLAYLKSIGLEKPTHRIAVEAHIFTPEGKIILQKRGKQVRDEVGRLEGIGGSIGGRNDLLQALQERISRELGTDVKVEIDLLLEVRQVQFEDRDGDVLDWIVVSYLCRLLEGHPTIGEPAMTDSLQELTLDEFYAIDGEQLSRSTIAARTTYRAKYADRPYYQVTTVR